MAQSIMHLHPPISVLYIKENCVPVFEVLPGLPPYGALPKLINNTGSPVSREGLVVRFLPETSTEWVGNFQHGFGRLNLVVPHPNCRDVVVIAGGECYVVDPDTQAFTAGVGHHVEHCMAIPETTALLFSNGLELWRLGPSGIEWCTRRLAWDGFRNLGVTEAEATAEAGHFDGSWHPFRVDLATGRALGGACNGLDS